MNHYDTKRINMQLEKLLIFSRCMADERAALLVRLAPELKMKLIELAKRERRSLSKQVEILLEQSLLQKGRTEDVKTDQIRHSRRER
jgi:hypothetical protein